MHACESQEGMGADAVNVDPEYKPHRNGSKENYIRLFLCTQYLRKIYILILSFLIFTNNHLFLFFYFLR